MKNALDVKGQGHFNWPLRNGRDRRPAHVATSFKQQVLPDSSRLVPPYARPKISTYMLDTGSRQPIITNRFVTFCRLAVFRRVGELSQPDQITVAGGGRGRLTVDVESARAILEAAEVDPDYMPESLDGAVVDVTIYPDVEQVWAGDLTLFQTESPEVDYPEGVDTAQLGQALLQLLGMTPGEARRLAQNIDWNSTLVLPVPQDLATFSEVTVNGNSALAHSGGGQAAETTTRPSSNSREDRFSARALSLPRMVDGCRVSGFARSLVRHGA